MSITTASKIVIGGTLGTNDTIFFNVTYTINS
jgi:hypothetical protein